MKHPFKRIAAFGVDYLVVVAIGLLLFFFISPLIRDYFTTSPYSAQLAGFFSITLPVFLYFSISEGVFGRTLGKRALGLRVVRAADGEKAGVGRALVRNLVKFTPWELAHFAIWHAFIFTDSALAPVAYAALTVAYIGIFAFIVGLFIKKGRTLYDYAAGTLVAQDAYAKIKDDDAANDTVRAPDSLHKNP